MAANVRHRLASLLALLRSPLAGCALLLVGSCLNPQPDPYPQAAGDTPSTAQTAPYNPNAGSTSASDQAGGGMNAAVTPTANSGAPMAQTPPPAAAPNAQPGGAGEADAGVVEPDGGEPDAAPAANL